MALWGGRMANGGGDAPHIAREARESAVFGQSQVEQEGDGITTTDRDILRHVIFGSRFPLQDLRLGMPISFEYNALTGGPSASGMPAAWRRAHPARNSGDWTDGQPAYGRMAISGPAAGRWETGPVGDWE